MQVHFGNRNAIEGYRDPVSDDPDLVRYRKIEGERVTSVIFPDGIGLQEAYSNSLAALSYHMEAGESPAWIECDSPGLTALLREQFPIARLGRPASWGHIAKDS